MDGATPLGITKTGMGMLAAPLDMIPEIVEHGAFTDDVHWVELGPGVHSRPLCLNVTEGYWAHLLRVRTPGVINRHRHVAPVQILTIKGHWHYPEKDWIASPGDFVLEPPGDIHTLVVPEGGTEMMFLSIVRGALIYFDEQGVTTGFDDVFSRIEAARRHFVTAGLGSDYVKRFIR